MLQINKSCTTLAGWLSWLQLAVFSSKLFADSRSHAKNM